MSSTSQMKGRHRRPSMWSAAATRAATVCAVPVALCVLCAGTAAAVPGGQPGVSTQPQGQPGVSTSTQSQPGVVTAPEPDKFVPGYVQSDRNRQAGWIEQGTPQPYTQPTYTQPTYTQPTYTEPVYTPPPTVDTAPSTDYQAAPTTPAPAPQVTPAPAPRPTVQRQVIRAVKAAPNTIQIANVPFPRPDFIAEADAQKVNNTLADLQAEGGNRLMDAGISAPQADRVSTAAVGGAVVGGLGGFAAGAVPAAVVTATGALIGTLIGVPSATGLATVFVPGIGLVAGPVLGGAAGAAIGGTAAFVAIGAPILLATTAIGAVAGAATAVTAFGGEDVTITEPAPEPAPSTAPETVWAPPVVDAPAVTAQAASLVDRVESAPGGGEVVEQVRTAAAEAPAVVESAASTARTALTQAPAVAEQVETAVSATPGGEQLGAQARAAVTDAAAAAGTAVDQAQAFADAALAGLQQG